MECHFFLTFTLDPRWESRRNRKDTLWRCCCCCLVTKSCPTLCKPMDCNAPGSSVHGILQVRILERVAISFSGDLPNQGIEPKSPALQTDSSPLSHGGTYSLKMVSFNSEHVIYLKKPQRFLLIKREPFNQIDSLVITVPLWGGGGDVQVQSDLPGCCLNYVRFRNRKKKKGIISSSCLGLSMVPEKLTCTALVFLPGQSCGQRSLACYSSWGHKRVRESDNWVTEHTHTPPPGMVIDFRVQDIRRYFPVPVIFSLCPFTNWGSQKMQKSQCWAQLLSLMFIQITISPASLLELPDCLLPSLWLFIPLMSPSTPSFLIPVLGLPSSLVTYPTAFKSSPFVPVSGPDTHMVLW